MLFQPLLVALYAQVAFSSSCKPNSELSGCPGHLPSLSPLERVQGLLTSHMSGVEALLNEVMGLTDLSDGPGPSHDTITQGRPEPQSLIADAQMPLGGPSPPIPISPIPPRWRTYLHSRNDCDCHCMPTRPPTSCCQSTCNTPPFALHPPYNRTRLGPVGITDAKGAVVPIQGQGDLVHLASFISRDVVRSLGLEKGVGRWPVPVPKDQGPGVVITGTISLNLSNIEDEFYVVDIVDPDHKDRDPTRFPDLSIGIELLRQVNGLQVHPDLKI